MSEKEDNLDEIEQIDWDNEAFPEFYEGIKVFNPKIGIVEKPSVFYDTAQSYGNIVKKKIDVDLKRTTTESESQYQFTRSLTINIPAEGTKLIKEEGQLLEWYLKRPIFRLLAKSDDRNRQTIYEKLQSDNVINWNNYRGTDKLLDTVYNLVEYYRCENQQGRIFIGSKQDIDDVYSRIPEKQATNQIETLINTRCGRDDLIPEEFQEDARFYKNELKKVEGTSAVGTMIATRNIVTRIVQKTIQEKEPEPEPEPQPQPKGEQGQDGEQGEGQGQEQEESDEQEDSSDKSESEQDSQANSHSCKECGKTESEESGAYDGYTCDDCYEGSEQQKQDEKEEEENSDDGEQQDSENSQDSDSDSQDSQEDNTSSQVQKQREREKKSEYQKGQELRNTIESAIQGKDTLGLDREVSNNKYSNDRIQTTQAKIDWEKPEQEALNKAKKDGEKQIQDVKKIFEKIALEQKEKILKELQTTQLENLSDRYTNSDKPLSSDKALVSKLAETFARIKTRRVFNTADSGIRVNIDNYIRRYAGDDKVKLFEQHDLDSGLDIAYVIDCSGSMDFQQDGLMRIEHAKKLLLTMVEATKNLKNVNNTIVAYGMSDNRAYTVKNDQINKLTPWYNTPSHIGLYHAMKVLKKKSNRNRKLIIHITDGSPQKPELTEFTVNQIKQQGIEIHTILVSDSTGNNTRYEKMYGKGSFTQIADFNKVRQIVSTTVAKRIFEILA